MSSSCCSSSLVAKDANSYVIEKLQKHDIIIFGEHHWVTEQMEFFGEMIPALYKNGVKCFALEFIDVNVQDLVDSLIYNDTYDVNLQNTILAQSPMFLRKANENILYELWKLQQQIGVENEKIKVLALSPRPITLEGLLSGASDSLEIALVENFYHTYVKPIQPEIPKMDPDSLMAKFVLDCYMESKTKVAIYCGTYHGFTKVYQYEPEEYQGMREYKGRPLGQCMRRMGNILYDELPGKVTNIAFMPFPIEAREDESCSTPLDILLEKQGINKVGFDLNSPFVEDYICKDLINPRMLPHFSVRNFYDGAIYLKPRKELNTSLIENEWFINLLPFVAKNINLFGKEAGQNLFNAPLCDCWKNNNK